MLNITCTLDGKICNPANLKELQLELNFDKDSPDVRLVTNKWRFVNVDADTINAKKAAGLTGGAGVFEAMLLEITLTDGTTNLKVQQALDLTTAEYSSSEITIDGKEFGKIDWINDIADSVSFQYLNEKTTLLPSSKYVAVPYVKNIPNGASDIIVLGISIVLMEEVLQKAVSDLGAYLAQAANPFESVGSVIHGSAIIIHLLVVLVAFVKLIKDLLDLIIQPVKYHVGMYVNDMIQAACDFLKVKYNSPVLQVGAYKNLFILPEKRKNPPLASDARILGFTKKDINIQRGYFNGTLGDLLRAIKKILNAKIAVIDNTLYIVPKNWTYNSPSYTMLDEYQPNYTTNATELQSNVLITFALDYQDKNTIDNYTGTELQVITQLKSAIDIKKSLLKNFNEVSIDFARAIKKTELTIPETIIKDFLDVISTIINALISVANAIITIINDVLDLIETLLKVLKLVGIKKDINLPNVPHIQPIDFGKIINDRIGMLKLESDVVSKARIFLLKRGNTDRENKIEDTNDALVVARGIYDNFYQIDSFVPSTKYPKANQYLRKKFTKLPFTISDFIKVKNNSRIFDAQGNVGKIESCKWNPWTQIADVDFRINQLFTNNLIETFHDGQGF